MPADNRSTPPPLYRSGQALRKYTLIAIALSYMALLVLLPLFNIFYQAFAKGISAFWTAITTPEATHAAKLTLFILVIVVPLNTLFGIAAAWFLVRRNSWRSWPLSFLLDIPLTVSPIILGLFVVMVYSSTVGLLAPLTAMLSDKYGFNIIYAWPGLVIASLLVSLPFVAKEIIPTLQALDSSQEQVAASLGATPWQTFWRVTFPAIRWSILYGIVICAGKTVGDFGAVSVVSGRIIGETNTLTLYIEREYMDYETVPAFAAAVLLTLVALTTLALQLILKKLAYEPSENSDD
jgi:sulfate/thiosulfate transport system permease protein